MLKYKKSKISFSLSIIILLNVFVINKSFALEYDNANHIFSQIANDISTKSNNKDNSNITFITIKNVNLALESQYQTIHDNLVKMFPNKEIFDVYITTSNNVIIPKNFFISPTDDESKYNDSDSKFKNNMNKLGFNHISIKNSQCNLTEQDYNNIAQSIADFYTKYFYLTDQHINHVYNKLAHCLEIGEVKENSDAVGEFVGREYKIILSPKLFNTNNNEDFKKKYIEYVVKHEMGHAVEMSLCKKIFEDLNLNNISKENCIKLSEIYCCDTNANKLSELIKQKVLDDLKVPKNEESRQSYSKTYLSDYSNQNPFEWFAEAVALGCINDENKKNKLISPLVENEIKNIIAGKGEVYEELKRSALKFLQESLI